MACLLIRHADRRIVNLFADDATGRRFWGEFLQTFAGISGAGGHSVRKALRMLGKILRRPGFVRHLWGYTRYRMRQEGLTWGIVGDYLRGRAHGLNVVMHNFIDAAALEYPDQTVRDRLAACSFRGAVLEPEGWQAVPMCKLNAQLRPRRQRALSGHPV